MASSISPQSPLLVRLWQYQKERFPVFQNSLLIIVFTFSASAYSHICRGGSGFVNLLHLGVGAITAVLFFFLLRICDEFKDHEDDSRHRPYRPVPRGLISLRELGWIGVVAASLQILLNALIMPVMLLPYLGVVLYMLLMTKEFFIPRWLKKHPMAYTLSHMIIMPLIDIYTTGLDWLNAGERPPHGVELFFVVSYFNGMVIDVGRKIRASEDEERGVETYSVLYGPARATLLWLSVMTVTAATAFAACRFSGFALIGGIMLGCTYIGCALPALLFLRTGLSKRAHGIELASGIWSTMMYLIVGATPLVIRLLLRGIG